MTQNQLKALKKIGQRYDYGRGIAHVAKVTELSLSLFDGLACLKFLAAPQSDKLLLETAGYLHDIGISPEARQKVMTWANGMDIESCSNKHNLVSFKVLSTEIPELLASQGLPPLPSGELSIILYCVLWHCSDRFEAVEDKPLVEPRRTEMLAALLRIADALDRSLCQIVDDISLRQQGDRLVGEVLSRHPASVELERAQKKANLFQKAYGIAIDFTQKV